MKRYAVIETKLPREFVLLQGKGCMWAKCSFCDYHTDVSTLPYETNKEVLSHVTGVYGILDVINSGSALELDNETIALIQRIVREKNINTLWFEAHWIYRHRLAQFARLFAPATVKFRCGIESFDGTQRTRWNKGIPATVTPADVARYYQGVCLLCCTEGDTRNRIESDIDTARQYFEYASVNVFNNNTTNVKQDPSLVAWFVDEIYPQLRDDNKIEVLIANTDLGVG